MAAACSEAGPAYCQDHLIYSDIDPVDSIPQIGPQALNFVADLSTDGVEAAKEEDCEPEQAAENHRPGADDRDQQRHIGAAFHSRHYNRPPCPCQLSKVFFSNFHWATRLSGRAPRTNSGRLERNGRSGGRRVLRHPTRPAALRSGGRRRRDRGERREPRGDLGHARLPGRRGPARRADHHRRRSRGHVPGVGTALELRRRRGRLPAGLGGTANAERPSGRPLRGGGHLQHRALPASDRRRLQPAIGPQSALRGPLSRRRSTHGPGSLDNPRGCAQTSGRGWGGPRRLRRGELRRETGTLELSRHLSL